MENIPTVTDSAQAAVDSIAQALEPVASAAQTATETNTMGMALELLIVGMLTVFVILLIVIYLGKALIAAVNKFAPDETVAKKQPALSAIPVDATTQAVINEAVRQLTDGKGYVTKIQKL